MLIYNQEQLEQFELYDNISAHTMCYYFFIFWIKTNNSNFSNENLVYNATYIINMGK